MEVSCSFNSFNMAYLGNFMRPRVQNFFNNVTMQFVTFFSAMVIGIYIRTLSYKILPMYGISCHIVTTSHEVMGMSYKYLTRKPFTIVVNSCLSCG